MNMRDFAVSNKLVGIIKLSSPHSLPFWNSLTTLLMKRNVYSAFINFFFIRGISSSKFGDILFERLRSPLFSISFVRKLPLDVFTTLCKAFSEKLRNKATLGKMKNFVLCFSRFFECQCQKFISAWETGH